MRKHILVVDDHESNSLVTTMFLKEFGYTFDVASDGTQAIQFFMQGPYDALLMDIQMPGMSGLEVTAEIRQIEKKMGKPHTPIIALTAHVQPANREQALNSGMDDFLAKPFDSYSLRSKLDAA